MKDVKRMLEYYQALGFDSLPLSLKALPVANGGTALNRNESLLNLREEIGDCQLCNFLKAEKILSSAQATRMQG